MPSFQACGALRRLRASKEAGCFNQEMHMFKTVFSKLAAIGLGVALAASAGVAQARDNVNWSIGIGVPGVVVGASNGYSNYGYNPAPVYYAPPPTYYAPRPTYYAPPPMYYAPPRPVYYAPPVVYSPPPYYGGRYYRDRDHYRGNRHNRHDRRR